MSDVDYAGRTRSGVHWELVFVGDADKVGGPDDLVDVIEILSGQVSVLTGDECDCPHCSAVTEVQITASGDILPMGVKTKGPRLVEPKD